MFYAKYSGNRCDLTKKENVNIHVLSRAFANGN